MRTRIIQNEILIILSDHKIHSAVEMAIQLEICVKTVYRVLSELSLIYPITSYRGGRIKGYRLFDDCELKEELRLNKYELDYIVKLVNEANDKSETEKEILIKKLKGLV